MEYKVGEKVYVEAMSGMCTGGEETITSIRTEYDKDTGEPYNVACCGAHCFRVDNGKPVTPPWSYKLRKLKQNGDSDAEQNNDYWEFSR